MINNKNEWNPLKLNLIKADANSRKKISKAILKSLRKELIEKLNKKLDILKGKFFNIDFDSKTKTYAMYDPTITEKYCDIVGEDEIGFFLEALLYEYIELNKARKIRF